MRKHAFNLYLSKETIEKIKEGAKDYGLCPSEYVERVVLDYPVLMRVYEKAFNNATTTNDKPD